MSKKVVVLGGGVLGTQIGLVSAYNGYDVTYWLRSESSVGRTTPKIKMYTDLMMKDLLQAKALINNPLGKFLYPKALIPKWEGITVEQIDGYIAQCEKRLKENIHIELDMKKALDGAYLVIESMSENIESKKEVYAAIKDLLPKDTILCTNTSTLLPSMFAQDTGRPEKYCALHFANNIWTKNTAEVMGHPGTDPKVFDEVVKFAASIGMVPLQLHKEQPGYLLNSLLVPFLSAAQQLWANEVSDPKTIDLTWELATGAPMGPFKILDIVGLETAYNISLLNPKSKIEGSLEQKVAKLLKEKIDKGETGINAKKGFYNY